jgi:NitT/TauT family transport system substrate-binding protein
MLAASAGLFAYPILPAVSDSQLRKLVVQVGSPGPNAGFMPIYIAQQQGFFRDEGLEVELHYGRGAPLAAQLAAAGKVDIGHFTYDPVIVGYPNGLRGKFFYQYFTRQIYFIGVPEDGPIKEVKQLAGRKLGVVHMGSAAITLAKSMFREAGIDPASVTFVPVGAGAQALSALNAKQIDGVALWNAAFGGLAASGARLRYFHHLKLDRVGSGGYFANDAMLKDSPKDLIGFGRAAAKGTAFFLTNPEAALQIYWKVNPAGRKGGTDEDALKRGFIEMKYILDYIQPVSDATGDRKIFGSISMDEIQADIDVFAGEMNLKPTPTAKDIATAALVPAMNDFDCAAVQALAAQWKP